MSLSMVYRAINIHAIAAKQMSFSLYRETADPYGQDERLPITSFIRRPDNNMTRAAFVELCVTCLATTGNCYWRKTFDDQGRIINAEILDPRYVSIRVDKGVRYYRYAFTDREYTSTEIQHLKMMRVAGSEYGLGPIQAARCELDGALDLRDYQAAWFSEEGASVPTGLLSSDQTLNPETATLAKKAWTDSQGGRRGVAVLGQGLSYAPILLNPKDALFIDNMQFTTTQIARLFGAPSSLMLATVEGNSQTYSNIEQDWLGFLRFSNMQYLIEVEEALSELLPRMQYVKFDVEKLLRTDTATRYESYKNAIEAGWLLKSEVRKIENYPPKPGIDKVVTPPVAAPAKDGAAA